MDRRTFLCTAAVAATASRSLHAEGSEALRVGVIGHTGRGNYGHGLDTVWLRLPETRVVAVADADPAGLTAATERLKSPAGFADYRQMLDQVRPELVAICPRHPDQHLEMTLAALESGAKGIYMEKPFCRTPAEADQMLAAADARGAKIALAHRNRYHPALQAIDRLITQGAIGNPLEIRGRGKGDRRGGAEDLWVLGSHVLNLINYFGGPARSCSAILRQDGRPFTRQDIRPGNEALGPIAGNQLHARFELENGWIAYFDSIADDGTGGQGFGLQIIGSEGIIDLKSDRFPLAHLIPGNPFEPSSVGRAWVPISSAGPGKPEPIEDLVSLITHNVLPVRDLIASIGTDRRPLCDAREGAMTIEMICGTFASHQAGGRAVTLPLESREHPFAPQ
jgi:predicted dehydrogenase